MDNLEGAIATARVLLNEVERIYKNGNGSNAEDILALVTKILEPYPIGYSFGADSLTFRIVAKAPPHA